MIQNNKELKKCLNKVLMYFNILGFEGLAKNVKELTSSLKTPPKYPQKISK